uniref:Uncharacterized protein n=1 Tax=Caenorhabditis japonica TaxID=281687 RepID=A0A8R1E408_CAEJA
MRRHHPTRSQTILLLATVTAALSFSACMFVSKDCATSSSVLSMFVGAAPVLLLVFSVVRNHASTVEKLQKTHEAQTAEKSKEFERSLGEERARKEAEMSAMNSRHQKVVACLDEKIVEAEKTCEQLSLDKKTLQAALANDCDHRNQMLTKEISSLQTALEMKSSEMKELRQRNQNLSLQVDEIPLKELEISKWRHKANEYKQMLDQKINGEKILVQQIEDLRRKQIHDEEEKEAMKRSFDLMQFKYENGEDVAAPIESGPPGYDTISLH